MNEHLALRIADRLQRDGFDVGAEDVGHVYLTGTHPDAAVASAILNELEEYGVTLPVPRGAPDSRTDV